VRGSATRSNAAEPLRRVGGYNIDVFHLQSEPPTRWMAPSITDLLSEARGRSHGRGLTLKLAPLPAQLSASQFPTLFRAMECAQHPVRSSVRGRARRRTMIGLARDNPSFRAVIERALKGEPEAIPLVEFIGETGDEPLAPSRPGDADGRSRPAGQCRRADGPQRAESAGTSVRPGSTS
jgi:hypothetical protein